MIVIKILKKEKEETLMYKLNNYLASQYECSQSYLNNSINKFNSLYTEKATVFSVALCT